VTALLGPRTLERLSVLDVVVRGAAGGGRAGDRSAGVAGVGTIFREHRTYYPGDDPRYVDWNAYGRLRSLHVKVFEFEENLDVHLLVDATASMGSGPGSKFEAARRAAAMVGAVALARGDVVRATTLPGRATPAMTGSASTGALLDALAAAKGDARTPLEDAVRAVFPRIRRRAFALIVTDFLDNLHWWRRAIEYLGSRRVEIVCLHVVSPGERNPPSAGSVRLRDVETGEDFDVEVDDDVVASYRLWFDRRMRAIRAFLRSQRVQHVVVDSSRAEEADLLRHLLREGVLR
jgi:uncharacterized protein (DUF58 family)